MKNETDGGEDRIGTYLDRIDADRPLRRAIRRAQKVARAEGILDGLRAAMGPTSVFVDCGAHYGETTLAVADSGAQIHSFEPDPANWLHLTAACGHLPNVTLHNAAVAKEDGSITIYGSSRYADKESWRSSGSSTIADNTSINQSDAHEVRAISLLGFLRHLIEKHGRITILKMDIEGAEVEILEQLIATDIFNHINLTLVETHRWLFPNMRDRYAALYDFADKNPDRNLYLQWI